MSEIDDLRAATMDTSEVMLGVQLADMAFFEGVAAVLKLIDPNASNTIKQIMDAQVPAWTKPHGRRVQDAALSRAAAIAECIRR